MCTKVVPFTLNFSTNSHAKSFILLITLLWLHRAHLHPRRSIWKDIKFMDEVTENYKTYSPEQWEMANEKFARFNNQWYLKSAPT